MREPRNVAIAPRWVVGAGLTAIIWRRIPWGRPCRRSPLGMLVFRDLNAQLDDPASTTLRKASSTTLLRWASTCGSTCRS